MFFALEVTRDVFETGAVEEKIWTFMRLEYWQEGRLDFNKVLVELFEVKAKQFIVHQLKTFELAKDAHLEQEEDVVDAVLVAFIIHLGFSF